MKTLYRTTPNWMTGPATLFLTTLLLLSPTFAHAAHFEISRLATQLNLVSGQLAHELRSYGGYSSIRQGADRLSREAADLVDAVRRNRSDSYVRSQFNDVSKRYEKLEDAYLRLHQNRHDPYIASELQRINSIYSSLNAQFYYGSYSEPQRYNSYPYAYRPPVIIQRYDRQPYSQNQGHNQRNQKNQRYNQQNQRSFGNPPRQSNKKDQKVDRRDYGRVQVQRQPNFDHRSPVLERQQRQQRQDQRQDNHRPAVGSESRNRQTETRRRNHFE